MKSMLTCLIIAVILFISSKASFGQDKEMMGFINKYREYHGKSSLMFNNNLYSSSNKQVNVIVNQDYVSHSDSANEIAFLGKSLPATSDSKVKFTSFLSKIFGITYEDPKDTNEVKKLTKLYVIFMFDQSPKHKIVLLDDYKEIGFKTTINNITYKSNVVTMRGRTYKYKNLITHYAVNFCSVMTFKR